MDVNSAVALFLLPFHSKIVHKVLFSFKHGANCCLMIQNACQNTQLSTLKSCKWISFHSLYISTRIGFFQTFILLLLYTLSILISIFALSRHPQGISRLADANISLFYAVSFPDGKQGCCLWQQKLLVAVKKYMATLKLVVVGRNS